MILHPIRLHRLLNHLSTREFQPLPSGVGLKTVNEAAEAGLIEREPRSRFSARPRCKLTTKGSLLIKDEQAIR